MTTTTNYVMFSPDGNDAVQRAIDTLIDKYGAKVVTSDRYGSGAAVAKDAAVRAVQDAVAEFGRDGDDYRSFPYHAYLADFPGQMVVGMNEVYDTAVREAIYNGIERAVREANLTDTDQFEVKLD